MYSGSTLTSPLSPKVQLETTSSKKCQSAKVKILVGCFFFVLAAFLASSLTVYFTTDHQRVETDLTQAEFEENAEVLHLGDFSICAWETVPVAETVLVNGKVMNFTTPVIEGETCDTGELVILVIGSSGVHGSIGSTRVTAESETVSRLEEEDLEGDLPSLDEETPETEARARQWLHDKAKFAAARGVEGRRQLQQLTPGLVDVHLHLDLDKHMVDTMGEFGAAEYAVDLVGVINRDVYYDLGFNLKVVSINLRETYVAQSTSTRDYLDVIQAEGLPETGNVNLVHSLSTRSLGGGIAYLGGLYSPQYYGYGVSGSLRGEFNKWDLVVVAHELGHNFGAEHTHEMTPQVDTCGNSCPADASGATIMSYCHLCSGGLNNIDFVFHPEVEADILGAYDARQNSMAARRDCTEFATDLPDIGVPFWLRSDGQCVNMPGGNPTDCELQNAWVREAQTGPFQLIALTDRGSCWSADCASKTVELVPCSEDDMQLFEFQGSELRSYKCDSPVTSTLEGAAFTLKAGGIPITQWCSPDKPVPTAAPTEPLPCANSNNGATDQYGDDCSWYDANPTGCGTEWDTADFRANEMCCVCGGGIIGTTSAPLTPEPSAATEEPTVETPEPTAATVEPTAETSEPTAATEEPTAETSEPTAATAEPTTSAPTSAAPSAATSEPTAATGEPTAATSEPTTPHPFSPTQPTTQPPSQEPTEATAEPTLATSEPTEATEEPTLATSEPTSATEEPTVVTAVPTAGTQEPGQCEDSNDGATDPWQDDCSWYEANPWGCGKYNDNDFFSEEMCCVCGGGRGGGVATPEPTMLQTPPPSLPPTQVAPSPTFPPTEVQTPPPTSPSAGEDICYIRECGCAPFLKPWCNANAHRLVNWCGQSKANCQACNGAWCPAGPQPTFSPTTPVTDSPTVEPPTPLPTRSPTQDLSTDSPTTVDPPTPLPTTFSPTEDLSTDSPTTADPTTLLPTTMSPTTDSPTTADPTEPFSTTFESTSTTDIVSYVEADIPEGKTCKNNRRILLTCRGQNPCSQSFCQQLCDDTEACMFYFFNQRGRCHLYSECNKFRRPTVTGVTMQKVLGEPTSTIMPTSTDLATTGASWEQGVKLTHFWDCNGMACDAPTLQPWDLNKYVASPGYSPQNPDNHGGAVYGEKMWLVGAASDSMSALLGEHDPCCGSSSDGSSGGCGKCVLMRVTDSVNSEWTALVMKKNRCPPWSNGCEAGKLHFDMAVPGYDNLQFSTANVCGLRGNTGFQSQQASAVLGDWYNQYGNTAAAGASLCSTLPPQFQEGCELFSSWGWTRGDPNAEYRVVDCPEAFKAHVAAQFDANGVVSSI